MNFFSFEEQLFHRLRGITTNLDVWKAKNGKNDTDAHSGAVFSYHSRQIDENSNEKDYCYFSSDQNKQTTRSIESNLPNQNVPSSKTEIILKEKSKPISLLLKSLYYFTYCHTFYTQLIYTHVDSRFFSIDPVFVYYRLHFSSISLHLVLALLE